MSIAATRLGHDQPIVVSPAKACQLLDCGMTRIYALLAAGELQSYLDGRSRKITVDSIHDFVERRLAAAGRKASS
jgi:excisionase family DNA binding protein